MAAIRRDNSSAASLRWPLVMASVLWVVTFLWFFYDQELPNNPGIRRVDIWELLIDEMVLGDNPGVQRGAVDVPSGWSFLGQRIPPIGTAGTLLLASWAIGQCGWFWIVPESGIRRIERLVLSLGLGLSCQSLVVLLAGLSGHLSRPALLLPAVLCGLQLPVLWWRQQRRSGREEAAAHRAAPAARALRRQIGPCLLTGLLLIPFAGWLLLGAISPQTDFDVREYHLQGPKEWFQQGQISFLRHNVYTSFPFLSEMFSLAGMVLDGDWKQGALSGQLLLACFAPLTSLTVYCLAARIGGHVCGLLAAVIQLTTPWTLRISIIAYAEGALTFFLTAAVLSVFLSGPCVAGSKSTRRMAAIAGFLSGSAMACKYTGLVSVVFPLGVLLIVRSVVSTAQNLTSAAESSAPPAPDSRSAVTGRIRHAAACALIFFSSAIVAVSPWLARNLYDTGNPIYPLGYSVFGSREWTPEMDARWRPAHAPGEHSVTQIPQHILDFAVRNDWTSGLLVALSVPALLLWGRIPGLPTLAALLLWLFGTWWALTHRIDRFWIPAIPLLSVLAALAWRLHDSAVWRGVVLMAVLIGTAFNVRFCLSPLVGFHAGLMDLSAAENLTIRSDLRQLNQTIPATARVLMVGEAEVFNAEFPLVYNTVFDDCLFEQWTADPEDRQGPDRSGRMRRPEDIRRILLEEKITHVYVNWLEILRYRSPGSYGYTDYVQPRRFRQLVEQGILEPPVALLTRPWSGIPVEQQTVIRSWDDWEQLVSDTDVFFGTQLYGVAHPL